MGLEEFQRDIGKTAYFSVVKATLPRLILQYAFYLWFHRQICATNTLLDPDNRANIFLGAITSAL